MADINRSAISLPSDVSQEILQKTQTESAVMRLSRRVALPGRGLTIPVITGDPSASWVSETGVKPVSNSSLSSKLMSAYKLAVIETFSNEIVRDARALYDTLIDRLPAPWLPSSTPPSSESATRPATTSTPLQAAPPRRWPRPAATRPTTASWPRTPTSPRTAAS